MIGQVEQFRCMVKATRAKCPLWPFVFRCSSWREITGYPKINDAMQQPHERQRIHVEVGLCNSRRSANVDALPVAVEVAWYTPKEQEP